ncbi:ABC transporter substrate-binding protein [Myxococcota bacterium]|nr:ABC transporter substrate-binding protein [Myxococcota bacterium]
MKSGTLWVGGAAAVLLGAGLVLVKGCGGGGGGGEPAPGPEAAPAGGDGQPERGDMLVVAYQADADVLMPPVEQAAATSAISDLVFPQTFHGDWEGSLKYLPRAVEGWEWDETHTQLTLRFRKDMKWSDGAPFTAGDYVFTADVIRDPKVASPRVSNVEHIPADGGFQKLDDHTVKVTFTHPYDETTMLAHAALVGLLPKHRLGDVDRASLRGHELGRAPIATGPFRVAKWDKEQQIVLEPNPDVKELPAPYLNRVVFKIVPEYTTRLVELENGAVDLVESINVEDYERLKTSHPELRFNRRGYRFMDYIAWNLSDPLFQDAKARRALSMAIDVDQLIQALLTAGGEAFGRPATSTVTPELKTAYNDQIPRLPYDPEKAKAMLAELGWKDSDGDGVLDKGGKPFKFRLDTNSGNPRRAKAVVLIQDQLKKIGVRAEINTVESNSFFENLRLKKYQAALGGWSAALFLDMTTMWHCDSEEKKYEFNFTGYCDPETDRIMEAALREVDPAKGGELWKQAQARIYEAQPYAFLYWRDEINAVHKRFRNVQTNILSSFHDLQEWWVPKAEQKYPY